MKRVAFATLLALAAAGLASAQAVPGLINYQGRLTGAGGAAITGTHDLTFNVFAAPCATSPCGDAGTPVWGPQTLAAVQLTQDGYFNVILGPVDASGGDSILTAFGTSSRYLEILVDGGGPILPRQQVLSAPFAARALNAGHVGDFKYSALPSDHYGWLICDGRAVSRATYSGLFAILGTAFGAGDGSTTFNLPDARGRVAGAIGQGQTPTLTQRALGQEIGEETHLQSVGEMPSHSHSQEVARSAPLNYRPVPGGGGDGNDWHWNGITSNTGGGQPFNVMQPTTFVGNLFILAGQ